jgi:hypothetical protein
VSAAGSVGVVEPETVGIAVEIVGLLVSPIHAYEGRPDKGPRPDPDGRRPESVEVRAGLGLVGDRYFGQAAHRQAAVTMLAAESIDAAARDLALPGTPDPLLTRRNLVLAGFPVDRLAAGRDHPGALFSLDSGAGPVRFRAHRPANPCRWMEIMLAPGAFRALRGRGGVRCEPLDDGVLRLGPTCLRVLEPARADA